MLVVGILVVTPSSISLVAYTMDAARLYDDELRGADVQVVAVKWHEGSLDGEGPVALRRRRRRSLGHPRAGRHLRSKGDSGPALPALRTGDREMRASWAPAARPSCAASSPTPFLPT